MIGLGKIENEVKLILKLSKLSPSYDEIEAVKNILIKGDFSPSKFFSNMFEHRVTQIIYWNLVQNKLQGYLHLKWRHVLENYSNYVRKRNEIIYAQMASIFEEFNKLNILFAPLKGTMLLHTTYGDYSLRYGHDIDILVQEKDLSTITTFLLEKGFIQCLFDKETGEMVPATKKQKIFHRMSTHELVPFYLKTDTPECNYIMLDIQFDIFNRAKNMRQYFDHQKLFESLVPTKSQILGDITFLKAEYNILQLASHLYQDATRILSIRERKDLELIKFIDLYEYTKRNISNVDWEKFAVEIIEYNLQHILYFSLFYCEQLLGSLIPEEFMRRIKPIDLEYLDSYGVEEEKSIKWEKPFMERMFNPNRVKEINNIDQGLIVESSKYRNSMEELS